MKKVLCAALAGMMVMGLSAWSAGAADFEPALDEDTECSITVAGNYSNFEALEAIFEDFNEYYPEVELTYTKLDDYNNMISTTLEGNEAPNIYVAFSWMTGREQYDAVFSHAENLADPSCGIDTGFIRPGVLYRGDGEEMPMVPVFTTTYGMLVNNDLFEKEGLEVPSTYSELADVCAAFREKGYESPVMGYTGGASSSLFYSFVYPFFCGTVAGEDGAVEKVNSLEASAGEYMRPALEALEAFFADGCADPDACAALEDNYEAVIFRFFEGDVPMMICSGDTVSGTKKRESQSEAFSAAPFTYTFVPVPVTEEGGYFLDMPSLQFAVNKDCGDLDMTNEFMRFLITQEELNRMAELKRLLTSATDLSFDSVYAPFGDVPEERTVSPEEIGLMDDVSKQVRQAAFEVGTGGLTVDEAVEKFGTFEN